MFFILIISTLYFHCALKISKSIKSFDKKYLLYNSVIDTHNYKSASFKASYNLF